MWLETIAWNGSRIVLMNWKEQAAIVARHTIKPICDDVAAATEPVTERPGWKALAAHCQQVRRLHLRKLRTLSGLVCFPATIDPL